MTDPAAELARLEGIPSAVAAARAAVDAVLRDRGLRVVSSDDRASAAIASSRASSELAGWAVTSPEAAGVTRMLTELPSLAKLIMVAPGQALARMHALWGRGIVPDDTLGRPRTQADVSARLVSLYDLLTTPTQASSIVLAALVHAELINVAPFESANDVVARAAEQAVLVGGGIDPHGVIVVSAGHAAAGPSYEQALQGYASGGVLGVRRWLEHCAAAITAGAERSPMASQPVRRRGPGSLI